MASIYAKEYQLVITLFKTTRISKGITQGQLADALGRPQSFIAKVENGERRLDIVESVHLSQLLGIEPEFMINKIPRKFSPLYPL